MKPDKLRALADALEPMAEAPRFEDFDVPAFVAWLRQCAEQQPVDGAVLDADGCVALIRRGTEDERCARKGARRLYAEPQPTARMIDAIESIRRHVADQPSALARAIVATCDSALAPLPPTEAQIEAAYRDGFFDGCYCYSESAKPEKYIDTYWRDSVTRAALATKEPSDE